MKWIELIILDQSYFKLNTDGSPIHLIILDEIVQNHKLLHDKVLNLLIKLFQTSFTDLDNLVQVIAYLVFFFILYISSLFCLLKDSTEKDYY